MNNNTLLDILSGCMNPAKVNQSQANLAQYSESNTFLQQLLVLIPNQDHHMLIMILSTLKNYMLAKWNPNAGIKPIPEDQKQLLRENVFNLYYEINHNEQAVNLYNQVLTILALAAYPWPGVDQQLEQDFNSNIFAAATFSKQFGQAYEYSTDKQQLAKVDIFVGQYFPKLENLIEQSLSNFNPQTSKLITIILKGFFCIIHTHLPQYLRNQNNFSKWFLYVKTILNAGLQNNIENERVSAIIFSRMAEQQLNPQLDSKFMKGWALSLIQKHGQQFIDTIIHCLQHPNGDQQTAARIMSSVIAFSKIQPLRSLLDNNKVNYILYDRLFPNLQITADDLELFNNSPDQFIRKDEDISSDMFKRNAEDAVTYLLIYCNFGEKSEMMKFIEYAANSLQSNTVSDRHKQVLVKQITKMSTQLKKNKFIKDQFETLTCTYFIPLLKIDSPVLNANICRLFAAFLDDMKLSDPTVKQLMSLIYDKMINKSLVLRYNAILAFTSLLSHEAASNSAKEYFSNILQIYVKMLDQLQHQNLLKCIESIVNTFSNEISAFAPNLIQHLLNKFKQNFDNDQKEQETDEDGNKEATAALSTLEQILQCPLSDDTYFKASEQLVPMFHQIFGDLEQYFGQILSLINVLVYKAKQISDFQNVYIICRKLLQGSNCQINLNMYDYNFIQLLNKASQNVDTEFQANAISILKNLIQKMPNNILKSYPYPYHPELILCMIQNKQIQPQQIQNLNTTMVNENWTQYLLTYTFMSFGQGQVTDPQNLKSITGISLFPWLKESFGLPIVKILLNQFQSEEDQDDDDYYEQNTMQMLQKYADEDEQEEQFDQFHDNQGVNYSFLYDSPYDSSKDRQLFVQKLKSLSNQDANALMNSLGNKDRARLQALFK